MRLAFIFGGSVYYRDGKPWRCAGRQGAREVAKSFTGSSGRKRESHWAWVVLPKPKANPKLHASSSKATATPTKPHLIVPLSLEAIFVQSTTAILSEISGLFRVICKLSIISLRSPRRFFKMNSTTLRP